MDPSGRKTEEAATSHLGFRLGEGDRGCLLLHGFTGTPAEVLPIAEALASRGWKTSGPLLPGHGTQVEELATTTWQDWFDCAEVEWETLGRTTRARVCVGLSMGALLALHLAFARPGEVAGLVLMAPALRLRNQAAADHALWISRLLPFLPERFGLVAKQNGGDSAARKTPAYDQVPLRALASMVRLQRQVRDELPRITAPALVLEGALDRTVASDAGIVLDQQLGSERVERRTFERSRHILTEDEDAGDVIGTAVSFLESVVARGA